MPGDYDAHAVCHYNTATVRVRARWGKIFSCVSRVYKEFRSITKKGGSGHIPPRTPKLGYSPENKCITVPARS